MLLQAVQYQEDIVLTAYGPPDRRGKDGRYAGKANRDSPQKIDKGLEYSLLQWRRSQYLVHTPYEPFYAPSMTCVNVISFSALSRMFGSAPQSGLS